MGNHRGGVRHFKKEKGKKKYSIMEFRILNYEVVVPQYLISNKNTMNFDL